jgi:hypothetical protein
MLAQANRSWTDDIYFSFLLPARLPGLDSRTSLASSGDSAREALYRRLERQRDLDWWQTLALAALFADRPGRKPYEQSSPLLPVIG